MTPGPHYNALWMIVTGGISAAALRWAQTKVSDQDIKSVFRWLWMWIAFLTGALVLAAACAAWDWFGIALGALFLLAIVVGFVGRVLQLAQFVGTRTVLAIGWATWRHFHRRGRRVL
jgi:fluoride ion exporter CrcB/FEX